MNSRIGRKLLLAIIICIVLTVVAVSVATISRASAHNDNLMGMLSDTGINILKTRLDNHVQRMEDLLEYLDDSGTVELDNDTISEVFKSKKETDGDFGGLCRTDGRFYWKTDNYNISDFDYINLTADGFSGIVVDPEAGLTIQCAKMIMRGGKPFAAAIVGMNLSDSSWLDEIKSETDSEVTIFQGNTRFSTTVIGDNGQRAVGTTMAANVERTVIENGQPYTGTADILGQKHYVHYEPLYDINNRIVGAYFSGLSSAESDKLMMSMLITNIVVAVVVAGISLAIMSYIAVQMIIKPIKAAERLAKRMNQGTLAREYTDLKLGNDELGDFVRMLEHTMANLNAYVTDIKQVLSEMGKGDFTARPMVEYIGDFAEIKESFTDIRGALKGIIGNINQTSQDVMLGSSKIMDGSQILADGTTKQAAAIEQLSASINEVTSKVHTSAQNASEAGKVSAETSTKIRLQNGEVDNMLEAMSEIKEKSDQIQNIIQAIDDIAFQTNILALNAAIEAAAAGASGKGFAVVADEVKNLAAKSAESARQTGELIHATIESVEKGTEIAQSTAETMKQVIELSDLTNHYINDISNSSAEQEESIEQIKVGIEQISEVVQQNSINAQQTAEACSNLSDQSTTLKQQIDKLKVV